MKSFFIPIIFLTLLYSCTLEKSSKKLSTGSYRASLLIQDNKEIPFVFDVLNDQKINIYNAEEVIKVHEISYENDSVKIKLPFFEGYITAKVSEENINGYFVKPSLDRVVPFVAKPNLPRFTNSTSPIKNVSGNWETVFSPNSEEDRYIAKGMFTQTNDQVTGTFRTTTGDYRYLEGIMDGDSLKLSTFDGAHAFLFNAKVTDTTMNGIFYSGNHWKEPFTATLNNNYELPRAETLTSLKEGFNTIQFSFPDKTGNLISLNDDRFKNKVTIVQIMGTWCPNCLDESKFYANYYDKNKSKDLEFVALAFEVAKTKEEGFQLINRLVTQTGINYPVLLAQYGSSSKIDAQKKLPMLNHVLSYPTSIFIDKKGKVRKIHTGFNGPATGEKYEEFKKEFDEFANKLLQE
ncbi:peroxiredoxin family protein [Tenacibaculum sp. MEBiC06402]|uniref:peroxiredoxin family protein n=1 Tax=unclassified Tenacibaculum TaxID=2635139 RepID=UPI003B9CFBE2